MNEELDIDTIDERPEKQRNRSDADQPDVGRVGERLIGNQQDAASIRADIVGELGEKFSGLPSRLICWPMGSRP